MKLNIDTDMDMTVRVMDMEIAWDADMAIGHVRDHRVSRK
jgi:hypothetical protein